MVLPGRAVDASQPSFLELAISRWQCRSLRPVLELIAFKLSQHRVPSRCALHAIVSSTSRVVGGKSDWWIRRTYSDRGTAGRGSWRPAGSILDTFESDLAPLLPLASG